MTKKTDTPEETRRNQLFSLLDECKAFRHQNLAVAEWLRKDGPLNLRTGLSDEEAASTYDQLTKRHEATIHQIETWLYGAPVTTF